MVELYIYNSEAGIGNLNIRERRLTLYRAQLQHRHLSECFAAWESKNMYTEESYSFLEAVAVIGIKT